MKQLPFGFYNLFYRHVSIKVDISKFNRHLNWRMALIKYYLFIIRFFIIKYPFCALILLWLASIEILAQSGTTYYEQRDVSARIIHCYTKYCISVNTPLLSLCITEKMLIK